MGRLQNKVAIVTGGASGIGAATVKRFMEEGAAVLFTDVDAARGQDVAARTGAMFAVQNVAQEEDWGKLAEILLDRYGRLDSLVNNAGVMSGQAIDATELDTWNRVIGINLTGMMLGCRTAIEIMRRNSAPVGGSIINLGSSTSFLGLPSDAAYTTSKTAVLGLTRSIAGHCALQRWQIRCNSIHPGPTMTGIMEAALSVQPEMIDSITAMTPMARVADPVEIANMAVYLASDESSYSTGGAFPVDGGVTSTHP